MFQSMYVGAMFWPMSTNNVYWSTLAITIFGRCRLGFIWPMLVSAFLSKMTRVFSVDANKAFSNRHWLGYF